MEFLVPISLLKSQDIVYASHFGLRYGEEETRAKKEMVATQFGFGLLISTTRVDRNTCLLSVGYGCGGMLRALNASLNLALLCGHQRYCFQCEMIVRGTAE